MTLYEEERRVFQMNVRVKKFIGMILLVSLVIIYSLVAMAIAANYLEDKNVWLQLAFFAVSGLFWIVPAMVIIRWMAKLPDPKTHIDPSNL